MDKRKAVIITIILVVALAVINNPTRSGSTVNDFLTWLQNAGQSVITFVSSIFKG